MEAWNKLALFLIIILIIPLANAVSPTGDPDGDGLINLQEVELRTNPNSGDTDGDGMPDGWEAKYIANSSLSICADAEMCTCTEMECMDPLTADAEEDYDGDGISNLDEYKAGSNPIHYIPLPSIYFDAVPDENNSAKVSFEVDLDSASSTSNYTIKELVIMYDYSETINLQDPNAIKLLKREISRHANGKSMKDVKYPVTIENTFKPGPHTATVVLAVAPDEMPEEVSRLTEETSFSIEGAAPEVLSCSDYLNETNCTDASCYWYDDACHDFEKVEDILCSDYLDETECTDNFCYWYNDSCHEEEASLSGQENPTCTDAGYVCCDKCEGAAKDYSCGGRLCCSQCASTGEGSNTWIWLGVILAVAALGGLGFILWKKGVFSGLAKKKKKESSAFSRFE